MFPVRTHCRRHWTRWISTSLPRFEEPGPSANAQKAQRNAYPFPLIPNPTPWQIFHLPPTASQNDIKTRYYDLVRVHHPDTAISQFSVDAEVAHNRFQAISSAYEVLRGKKPLEGTITSAGDFRGPSTAAWRAAASLHARSRPDLQRGGDDRWKDRLIVFGLLLTFGVFVAQSALTRRNAFADRMLTRMEQEREEKRSAQRGHRDSDLSAT